MTEKDTYLWFCRESEGSFWERVLMAIKAYYEKYKTIPTHCYVHPAMLLNEFRSASVTSYVRYIPDEPTIVDAAPDVKSLKNQDIMILPSNTVLNNHYYMLRKEQAGA